MNYGLKLKLSRIEKGYTQKQLAEIIGISTITLQSYERCCREPRIKTMKKISKILDKSVQELFFLDED
ncbi:helix-turn-helix family protein [Clostridium botulinum 202F]|uniref:helix-turn-helix transcriptional regulator n=1 Tax=Clostridium sp. ZBS4 TaxID=2949974 RepID=UPI00054077B5|nr:helix-turn-helix transcriptional regulator [Clostridium sp. ZBS4]AIY79890.1 helix-turn-helix family protein [Clostridium botulinum 202F]KAI3344818.1 helix-turn-helix transcriptional regulator [Clostridium botulinum]KON11695.1 hypothetical protein ACP50_16950 [Clostridium botulinum]MBY6988282.1 helix-turn-helix transcriptional regulator [Clostridium botulinum]NFH00583.1 helix-turn-helix transcriptional regulator [Clostridium botulinum]